MLCALALMAGACTSSRGGSETLTPGTARPATSATTTPPSGHAGPPSTRVDLPATTAVPGEATPTPGSTPSPVLAPGAQPTQDPLALSGPGSFAGVILSPGAASAVEFQLLEQSGAAPDSTALDAARNGVQRFAHKPVTSGAPVTIPPGPSDWSPAQLVAMADRYGTANQAGGRTAYLHYLFVHGTFQGNRNVLGVAIRGDVLAIFGDGVTDTPSLDTQRVLQTIYTHETGHILGLVDLYLHDGRGDPDDPSHCMCHSPDHDSVMYWSVDTIQGLLEVGPASTPVDFDAADTADLDAIHGGAPKGSHV